MPGGHKPWFKTLSEAELAKTFGPRSDVDLQEAAQDSGERLALGNSRTHGIKIVWTQIEINGAKRDVIQNDAHEMSLLFGFTVERALRTEGQLRLIWEVGNYAFPGRMCSVRTAWVPVSSFGDGDVAGVGQGWSRARDAWHDPGYQATSLEAGDGRYWWRPCVALLVPGDDPTRQHFAIGPKHHFIVVHTSDPLSQAGQGLVEEGKWSGNDSDLIEELVIPEPPVSTSESTAAGAIAVAIALGTWLGFALAWSPPEYVLDEDAVGTGSGQLRPRDGARDNLIRVGHGPRTAPPGYTRITLQAGETVTWWKAVGLSNSGANWPPTIRAEHAAATEGGLRAASMDIPSETIGPNSRLWLSQAKTFGVHTITGWIGPELLERHKGGHLVVTWVRDQEAGQIAVVT